MVEDSDVPMGDEVDIMTETAAVDAKEPTTCAELFSTLPKAGKLHFG